MNKVQASLSKQPFYRQVIRTIVIQPKKAFIVENRMYEPCVVLEIKNLTKNLLVLNCQ